MSESSNDPGENLDFRIYRGDSFQRTFTFTQSSAPYAVPTTGWTAEIRALPDKSLIDSFTVDSTLGAAGVLNIYLDQGQTAALTDGVWDFQNVVAGVTRTYFRGNITVVKDVTKPDV